MTVTFSRVSHKIAAGVITAAIIGLFTVSMSAISSKVDEEKFMQHCTENERELERLKRQFEMQNQVNHELLQSIRRIEIKLERVETNTEWLIKEVRNGQN